MLGPKTSKGNRESRGAVNPVIHFATQGVLDSSYICNTKCNKLGGILFSILYLSQRVHQRAVQGLKTAYKLHHDFQLFWYTIWAKLLVKNFSKACANQL